MQASDRSTVDVTNRRRMQHLGVLSQVSRGQFEALCFLPVAGIGQKRLDSSPSLVAARASRLALAGSLPTATPPSSFFACALASSASSTFAAPMVTRLVAPVVSRNCATHVRLPPDQSESRNLEGCCPRTGRRSCRPVAPASSRSPWSAKCLRAPCACFPPAPVCSSWMIVLRPGCLWKAHDVHAGLHCSPAGKHMEGSSAGPFPGLLCMLTAVLLLICQQSVTISHPLTQMAFRSRKLAGKHHK